MGFLAALPAFLGTVAAPAAAITALGSALGSGSSNQNQSVANTPAPPTPPEAPTLESTPEAPAPVEPTLDETPPALDAEAAQVRSQRRRTANEQARLFSLGTGGSTGTTITKSLLGS